MSRQTPPPCNAFYLIGHCDVPRCRYEHRYNLTSEQVEEMRRGAKVRSLSFFLRCHRDLSRPAADPKSVHP